MSKEKISKENHFNNIRRETEEKEIDLNNKRTKMKNWWDSIKRNLKTSAILGIGGAISLNVNSQNINQKADREFVNPKNPSKTYVVDDGHIFEKKVKRGGKKTVFIDKGEFINLSKQENTTTQKITNENNNVNNSNPKLKPGYKIVNGEVLDENGKRVPQGVDPFVRGDDIYVNNSNPKLKPGYKIVNGEVLDENGKRVPQGVDPFVRGENNNQEGRPTLRQDLVKKYGLTTKMVGKQEMIIYPDGRPYRGEYGDPFVEGSRKDVENLGRRRYRYTGPNGDVRYFDDMDPIERLAKSIGDKNFRDRVEDLGQDFNKK